MKKSLKSILVISGTTIGYTMAKLLEGVATRKIKKSQPVQKKDVSVKYTAEGFTALVGRNDRCMVDIFSYMTNIKDTYIVGTIVGWLMSDLLSLSPTNTLQATIDRVFIFDAIEHMLILEKKIPSGCDKGITVSDVLSIPINQKTSVNDIKDYILKLFLGEEKKDPMGDYASTVLFCKESMLAISDIEGNLRKQILGMINIVTTIAKYDEFVDTFDYSNTGCDNSTLGIFLCKSAAAIGAIINTKESEKSIDEILELMPINDIIRGYNPKIMTNNFIFSMMNQIMTTKGIYTKKSIFPLVNKK